MSQQEAVICIGAGLLQTYMLREIQTLGFLAIATDADPAAPGFAVADDFYIADTYDLDATRHVVTELAHHYTIRGVVTCGADVAPTVSAAAEALGLPHLPLEIARLTHDKAKVRQRLHEAGLDQYQPRWTFVHKDEGLYGWHQAAGYVGYPLVVKPRSQRASRGVTLVQGMEALAPAIRKALSYGQTAILEERLIGSEHSMEMLLDASGAVVFFNLGDRVFSYAGGLAMECGHMNPTCLVPAHQHQMLMMLQATARALGVTWGPFKMDALLTTEGHPMLLECTARLSGGFDAQRTCPLTGRHPMRTLLQLACDLPVTPQLDITQAQGYAACAAILPAQQGRITTLPGAPDGVEVIWAVKAGETIAPAQHNGERAGYVLATGEDYQTTWARARTLAEYLATAMVIEGDNT
jgi:biotin carboxylase